MKTEPRAHSLPLRVLLASLALASCSKKEEPAPPAPPPTAATPNLHATAAPLPPAAAPSALAEAGGAAPPDGKYERVTVEGVTVPMINVMNSGTVVLVDTDGKKPRTWEEQYKRKRDLPAGSFDIHKTDVNKNDSFEDDKIDREGLWVIDPKGNIVKR